MIAFDAELRALARRLDLPEPVRSRTLLELRADLEDMATALRSEGMDEDEARRRSLAMLLPSPAAIAEIRALHRPLRDRLVDRWSARGRHRLEHGLLAVTATVALGGGLLLLGGLDLLASPSPWLWPVLGIAALVAGVGAAELHPPTRGGSRSWSTVLPILGVAAIVVAVGGAIADAWSLAGRLAAAPDAAASGILVWLRRDAALLSVSLLVATAAGLVELRLAIRAARVTEAEAAALGLPALSKGRMT